MNKQHKQLVTFWADKQKHARFKAKAFLEHTDISKVLNKAIDDFIGKGDIKPVEKEEKEVFAEAIIKDNPEATNKKSNKHQTFFKDNKKKK